MLLLWEIYLLLGYNQLWEGSREYQAEIKRGIHSLSSKHKHWRKTKLENMTVLKHKSMYEHDIYFLVQKRKLKSYAAVTVTLN